MEEEGDILIFDTGGGNNWTITRRVWHVFEYINNKQRLLGYQNKIEGGFYLVVNSVTKEWIQGRYLPVVLGMNYSTLLYDTN